MTDVKNLLIDTLTEEYNYPVILQGSLSTDDVYPESFFTFWNNNTADEAFFDNEETQTIWDFDLNFYEIEGRFLASHEPIEGLERAY